MYAVIVLRTSLSMYIFKLSHLCKCTEQICNILVIRNVFVAACCSVFFAMHIPLRRAVGPGDIATPTIHLSVSVCLVFQILEILKSAPSLTG